MHGVTRTSGSLLPVLDRGADNERERKGGTRGRKSQYDWHSVRVPSSVLTFRLSPRNTRVRGCGEAALSQKTGRHASSSCPTVYCPVVVGVAAEVRVAPPSNLHRPYVLGIVCISRIVPSSEALAYSSPSGLKEIECTGPW